MIRRILIVAVAGLVIGAFGCQKEHPMSLEIDPAMEEPGELKIAVFPFMSALHESEDPDGLAVTTMEKHFKPALDGRNDYTFISSSTLTYAIEGQDMRAEYNQFLAEYPRGGSRDPEFFSTLADLIKADAFLIPVVDLWQKDEVDYQENATPATYAGATITVVDATGQKVLFRATDENYIEGARSETGDRGIVSTGGRVRSDSGAKTHRAPPYEEVAILVIDALVGSLPPR
jgi:hypothetical protein